MTQPMDNQYVLLSVKVTCHGGYNDHHKGNKQRDNPQVKHLPQPFHPAARSSGGHFFLKQKGKENEDAD
jgi:hypothetical protein